MAAVRNGAAECLPDEQGRVILPSAVRYLVDTQGRTRRQIGFDAIHAQAEDPLNTVKVNVFLYAASNVPHPPVWHYSFLHTAFDHEGANFPKK